MRATEARQKALSIEAEKVKDQYEGIMKLVKKSVSEGKLYAYGYGDKLLEGTKKELEKEGFIINESFDQRDGHLLTITW